MIMLQGLGWRILLFVFFCSTLLSTAQELGFVRDVRPVVLESGDTMKMPWSGGINYAQFSHMDLDLDGQLDMIVFDKSGARIIPFLYVGSGNEVKYRYAPEYSDKFPENIKYWCISRDYDGDGKYDLFYHVSAGIGVSRNISTQAQGLKFEWAITTPQIHSDYGSGSGSNLYVSAVDIPAIEDIDGDGDLDILTFSILGGNVEYHLNRSQEFYGNSDSLDFKMVDGCWGNFTEDFSYNKMYLDSCPGQKPITPIDLEQGSRHSGSTLLAIDEDGNGLMDLLVGDVTFWNGTMLYNDGTIAEADMTEQDTAFPSTDVAILIEVFPGFFSVDVDMDGDLDLVSSPNKEGSSLNYESVWYYENEGSNSSPDLSYKKDDLFQGEMIDLGENAYPRFLDENQDGLMDMIVGNRGYYQGNANFAGRLALFRNVGDSAEAVFELIDRDYADISQLNMGTGLIPTFGDLDGDGDEDMILGTEDGKIHGFTNTAGAGNPPDFVLSHPNYMGLDVGNKAAPFLVDLDRDGLIDLTIGDFYGQITYYHNDGTTNIPDFVHTKDTLGGVDMSGIFGAFGNCVPYFIDMNGSYRLAVGSTHKVSYYDNIDSNVLGSYNLVDSVLGDHKDGTEFAPALYDLNYDGWMEMTIGNLSGGLAYYHGIDTNSISTPEPLIAGQEYTLYPNPANDRVFIKGELSQVRYVEIYDLRGRLLFRYLSEEVINGFRVELLPPGIYLIRITDLQGRSGTQRLVVR
jgi:hypothetical protein